MAEVGFEPRQCRSQLRRSSYSTTMPKMKNEMETDKKIHLISYWLKFVGEPRVYWKLF